MPQSEPITAAQHTNTGQRSTSIGHCTLENLVRNVDLTGRVALARGNDAQTTTPQDQNARSSVLSVSGGRRQEEEGLSWIVDFPQPLPLPQPATTFHALQEWEGYVLEIGETDFVARLVDLTAGPAQEEEEAVIPLVELSDEDAAKMCPGSIFRWVIGYERTLAGSKRRVSQIVFRDLPAITSRDFGDGETWALETIRSLGL
jgi:hypothetical protein